MSRRTLIQRSGKKAKRRRIEILRRGRPQVIVFSFSDFAKILVDDDERRQIDVIIKELRPEYGLGQVISSKDASQQE